MVADHRPGGGERARRKVNTVQNGKGDRPRSNWGPKWYAGYAAVNWRQKQPQAQANSPGRIPFPGEVQPRQLPPQADASPSAGAEEETAPVDFHEKQRQMVPGSRTDRLNTIEPRPPDAGTATLPTRVAANAEERVSPRRAPASSHFVVIEPDRHWGWGINE